MMKFTINGTVKSVKNQSTANLRNIVFASGFLLVFFVTGLLCVAPDFRENYAPILFAVIVPFSIGLLLIGSFK